MVTLGVRIEPNLHDTVSGDSESTHLTIFIRRFLTVLFDVNHDILSNVNGIDAIVFAVQRDAEDELLKDIDACRDASMLAELIRRILQDGIAESRDTSGRGYGDDRDSLFADVVRSQVPPGLSRASGAGDGGEESNGDTGDDAGCGSGGGGEDGGDDGEVAELSHFEDHVPPSSALCIFCNVEFSNERRPKKCWEEYLKHLYKSHFSNGADIITMRPDFRTPKFMLNNAIMSQSRYNLLCEIATERMTPGNT